MTKENRKKWLEYIIKLLRWFFEDKENTETVTAQDEGSNPPPPAPPPGHT